MRHFKLYFTLMLLLAATGIVSCSDDFDSPPIVIPTSYHIDQVNTTILELKEAYWSDDKNYIDTIGLTESGDTVVICGRVISSDETGNIYKSLVIQDETAALAMSINGTSLSDTYRVGQEIVLPLTGMFIGKYNNLQQLGYPEYSSTYGWEATFLPLAMFQEIVELNGLPDATQIDTLTIKISELSTTAAGLREMQSQLVRIDNVFFQEADGTTTFSEEDSSTSRYIEDESGNTMIVRNSCYASFQADVLPEGTGSVVGILSYYSSSWQLLLRDTDDLIGFSTDTEGTVSNPYTVARAIELQGTGKTGWVSGYLVGAVAPEVTSVSSNDDIEWTAPTTLANTIVVGATATTDDISECLVIQLTQGTDLRSAANLLDNPDALGTGIKIYGEFINVMDTYGMTTSGDSDDFVMEYGEDEDSEASGSGTLDDPYNVAAAIAYTSALDSDETSDEKIYIKGIIASITEEFSSTYGNATFYISDDGSTTTTFLCYRVYYLGNAKWTSSDTQIAVGDEVVIYGNVVNYYGNTPETSSGNAYIYSLNSSSSSDSSEDVDEDNTIDNPYTVAEALAIINAGTYTSSSVYVKGTISQIDEISTSYGNATYYISDDGSTSDQLEVYRGYSLNGDKFTSEDEIQVGDVVIVYGVLTMYYSTPEITTGSSIVSINGSSSSSDDSDDDDSSSSVSTNQDDFETMNGGSTSAYYSTYTSTDGWTATNCNLLCGGSTSSNPVYEFIGYKEGSSSQYAFAPCMNGKTTAVGTIESPTLSGGCGTLTFSYGQPYSESNGLSFQVDIYQNGSVVKTETITTATTQYTAYSASIDVNVSGSFSILFTNLSPSSSTSNKDRACIWNVIWTSYE